MPKMDEANIKDLGSQVAGLESDDFEPTDAPIPVDADDGEAVAVLIVGYAKGGKIADAKSVDLDLMSEGKETLKDILEKKLSGKEDGENNEEEE